MLPNYNWQLNFIKKRYLNVVITAVPKCQVGCLETSSKFRSRRLQPNKVQSKTYILKKTTHTMSETSLFLVVSSSNQTQVMAS